MVGENIGNLGLHVKHVFILGQHVLYHAWGALTTAHVDMN